MTLFRYDKAIFKKPIRTDQGYLKIPASISKADCVLTYKFSDGSTVKEFRPKEEVFFEGSIESAKQLPVIADRHVARVDSENTKELAIGFTGENIEKNGNTLDTNILVTDKKTIDRIDKGELVALSPGYRLDSIDKTPGIFNGERYDQIQRGIVYNHLALLPKGKGRQGYEIGLRLDSSDAILEDESEETRMKVKIRFDGKDYEIEVSNETEGQIVHDFVNRFDSMKKELEKTKGELNSVKDTLSKEKERADKAEDLETINAIVQARVDAISVLQRLDSNVKAEDLKIKSVRELHVDCLVANGRDRADFDDCSDDFILGAFSGITVAEKESKKGVGGFIPNNKTEERKDSRDTKDNPKKEMESAYSRAWTKKRGE